MHETAQEITDTLYLYYVLRFTRSVRLLKRLNYCSGKLIRQTIQTAI